MTKKSELTNLYNSKVKYVAKLSRPLDCRVGFALQTRTGLEHKAVMVTLENGQKFVIESGANYAVNQKHSAIIKNANNLGSLMGWKEGPTIQVKKEITVNSMME